MDKLFVFEKITKSLKRRGRDAVTVYIIRYILACRRSGWYPHARMRNKVGIKEASKKM